MMDPTTGRWLSEDPIGFTADVNLYRYVGNNPTNATDPTGLIAQFPDGSGGMTSIVPKPDPANKSEIALDIDSLFRGVKAFPSDAYLKRLGLTTRGKPLTSADFTQYAGTIMREVVASPVPFQYASQDQFVADVLYRAWVGLFAAQLNAANPGFPNVRGQPAASFATIKGKELSKYWTRGFVTVEEDGKEVNRVGLVLKRGTPAEGIREFFETAGANFTIDCATFVSLVNRRALLEVIGEKGYNELFKDVGVCGLMVVGDPIRPQRLPPPPKDGQDPFMVPGSIYSIGFDVDVEPKAYQQENTLVVGTNQLVGHPYTGTFTQAAMIAKLNESIMKPPGAKAKPLFSANIPFRILPQTLPR